LIGGRRADSASAFHLPFGDHIYQFDAGQQDSRTAKRLETRHGPRASLDCLIVLLDYVLEISDGRILMGFTIGTDCFGSREIGTAFVDGYRFWTLDYE
jgi:hypothetical protein